MRRNLIRAKATAGAAVAATALGLLTGPVAQATAAGYPTSHFHVPFGNSYAQGTLTWYNRGVGVTGTRKVYSVCQRLYIRTFDAGLHQLGIGNTSLLCPTREGSFTPFSVPADVAGGAAFASACLADSQDAPLGDCVAYARKDAG